MADGVPIQLPIKSVLSSDPMISEILRCRINSGDTSDESFDIRLDSDDSTNPGPAVFSVPAGTYVEDIGWQITTAFTASNIFTLGDEDGDSLGWIDSSVFNSTLVDTDVFWAGKNIFRTIDSDSDNQTLTTENIAANAGGKLYQSDGNIELGIGTGGSPAGGVLTLYIKYYAGWGVPRFGSVWDSVEY